MLILFISSISMLQNMIFFYVSYMDEWLFLMLLITIYNLNRWFYFIFKKKKLYFLVGVYFYYLSRAFENSGPALNKTPPLNIPIFSLVEKFKIPFQNFFVLNMYEPRNVFLKILPNLHYEKFKNAFRTFGSREKLENRGGGERKFFM
jgi:hypothetical protein